MDAARKLIFIIVMLAVAPSAFCQFSPRLDSMRVHVREKSGSYFTISEFNRSINRAIQRVCAEFPAIEKLDTVTVDSSAEGGALNSDFVSIKNVFYISGDTMRIPLQLVDSGDSLFALNNTVDANKQNLSDPLSPRNYHVYKNRLILHPKWYRGDTATFLIEYYAADSLLNANASQTQVILQYRSKIIDFAVEDILSR